jgi:four helix bundle protein
MESTRTVFRTFKDLVVWQEARKFRKQIYELSKTLPSDEKFNLVSQMRRAAVSLTNNIAEGHGRYHFQENIQFLRQSRGSLEELCDDLTVCEDERYATAQTLGSLEEQAASVRRLINAYIRYLKEKKMTTPTVVREELASYDTDDETDDPL